MSPKPFTDNGKCFACGQESAKDVYIPLESLKIDVPKMSIYF